MRRILSAAAHPFARLLGSQLRGSSATLDWHRAQRILQKGEGCKVMDQTCLSGSLITGGRDPPRHPGPMATEHAGIENLKSGGPASDSFVRAVETELELALLKAVNRGDFGSAGLQKACARLLHESCRSKSNNASTPSRVHVLRALNPMSQSTCYQSDPIELAEAGAMIPKNFGNLCRQEKQ